MGVNLLTLLLSCFCIFGNAKKLQVDVYYEALCPDSVRFITKQLYPSFQDVEKYINLDLVPFGFATANHTSGHWEFECQHGPRECFLNKVHTCMITGYPSLKSLDFVNCAMASGSNSNYSLEVCANETDVLWEFVEVCLTSGAADIFLAENGDKTKSVSPPITYIPTIIFDGVYSKQSQDEAEKHFLQLVCQLLKNEPDICKSVGVRVEQII